MSIRRRRGSATSSSSCTQSATASIRRRSSPGLDLALDRRERLGIVGPNGSGKSTALEIIAGRLDPTEGRVVRGSTVRVGYYDQRSRALDPDVTVRAALVGEKGEIDWRDRKLMERSGSTTTRSGRRSRCSPVANGGGCSCC